MESVPLLSCQDGARRVQLKDFGPTRNRKVLGSNPTSGSKTTAQRVYMNLLPMTLLAPLIIPHARTWPREPPFATWAAARGKPLQP